MPKNKGGEYKPESRKFYDFIKLISIESRLLTFTRLEEEIGWCSQPDCSRAKEN